MKSKLDIKVPNLSLFSDDIIQSPLREISSVKTEGIKYAGSKKKLLPHILSLASKAKAKTILDAFAGSTRVSQAFANQGYLVKANDISIWSKTLATCYLLNKLPPSHYRPIIDHLNNLPPEDGWFTENYGGDPNQGLSVGADGLKKPWQKHNTRKLDAIRNEIDRLSVSQTEKAVLITSLINALDKVDSTLGHFASYLNEWSSRSYKTISLEAPFFLNITENHEVHCKDIFELLPHHSVDLAYLDPPYGSNNEKMPPSRIRYSAYYHIWTTICKNDRPEVFGKAKRRIETSDKLGASVFEEFRRDSEGHLIAVLAIEKLLNEVNAKHVILSYSSGGRATAEQLNSALCKAGDIIELLEVDHKKNVMADMRWTNEWVREAEAPNKEFLFLIKKK